ncbi:hypothetical protein PIB30_006984 [Stylosanthes scabra]|uniref:Uncharacterized protein n=1 Tax=Stylosanthes scabra TaxID=79078 RepID=A0ABU6Z152_9FABA|nr:hypothetical protein [Stylosanthes scabra]
MTVDPIDVKPPHVQTGKTESDGEDPGDSEGGSSGSDDDEFEGNTPVDAMKEEGLIDIGDGGDDYKVNGGVELRVRHMFCSR